MTRKKLEELVDELDVARILLEDSLDFSDDDTICTAATCSRERCDHVYRVRKFLGVEQ